MAAQRVSVTPASHHVLIVGAGAAGRCAAAHLLGAGITDFAILERDPQRTAASWDSRLRPGQDVLSALFDDDTHAWTLKTAAGQCWRASVVIAAHRNYFTSWIPKLQGYNLFQGRTVHAAAWPQDFDPTGQHIAVIGVDATAGHYLDPPGGRLIKSAASVTAFAYPPRRFVADVPLPSTRVARWLRRHLLGAPAVRTRAAAEPVTSAIEAVTASGLRTRDGGGYRDHPVDAIVYGTGLALAAQVHDNTLVGSNGLTIRQAWRPGMEPYLGVAVHGFPNYFLITGPDTEAQTRYIVECVRALQRSAGPRIEVRRSSQQVFNERAYLTRPPTPATRSAFDFSASAPVDDEIYDGPALLTMADGCQQVRVRISGHIDPIDGQYHWQGTLFDSLSDAAVRQTPAVTLTIDQHSASARIVEQTPWGTRSIAGVGAPPFALA